MNDTDRLARSDESRHLKEQEDRWFDQMLLAQFTHEWYLTHMSAFCGEEHGAQ